MADWAQVALVVGPAAVTGLTGYFIARHQNQSAERRLKLQLYDASAREERQIRRQVRSAPLLAFRAELAKMAQKTEDWLLAKPERFTAISGEARQGLGAIYTDVTNSLYEYIKTGDFFRALFMLSDPELVNKAKEIRSAYTIAMDTSSDTAKEEQFLSRLGDIRRKVIELQELINQRLEAL